MKALLASLALLALAPSASAETAFAPERFFAGHTAGEGILRVLLGSARAVRVESRGRLLPDGTLLLYQDIRQEGAAPRSREWRLRRTAPGCYAGTLTDAAGPVSGEVHGRVLTLRYTMRSPRLAITQRLELQPDGSTVLNRLTASLLGLPVARLSETIVRQPR